MLILRNCFGQIIYFLMLWMLCCDTIYHGRISSFCRDESAHWWKEDTPYTVPKYSHFQLFGLRLTHFISKHSFEKRWDLLIRGKLPSLLLKSINFKWYTKYDLTTLTSYTIKYFFFLGHCQIIQTAQWTLSFHHIKILNQQQLKILCLYFFLDKIDNYTESTLNIK